MKNKKKFSTKNDEIIKNDNDDGGEDCGEDFIESEEESEEESDEEEQEEIEEKEEKKKTNSIKANSPFTKFYTDIYDQVKVLIVDDTNQDTNDYYNPKVIELLLDKYMPYSYVWSGFVLKDTDLNRLTNGCLEEYNGFRKKKTIKNRLPHRYLQDNFTVVDGDAINYIDIISNKSKSKIKSLKRHLNSDDDFDTDDEIKLKHTCVEEWQKKRTSFIQQPFGHKQHTMGYNKPVDFEIIEKATYEKKVDKKKQSIFKKKGPLLPEDASLLLKPKEWLSNFVMQGYFSKWIKSLDFLDTFLMESVTSTSILVTCDYEYTLLEDIDFNKYNKIVGFVNIDNNHWNCFYANKTTAKFIYIDPYGASPKRVNNCLNQWKYFCSIRDSLANIDWELSITKEYTKQKRKDTWNCGVYCIQYLKSLVATNSLETFKNNQSELRDLRIEMHDFLKH